MIFLFVLLFLPVVEAGSSDPARAAGHDGDWWLSLPQEQRPQFVAGYATYYSWKLRGGVQFSGSAAAYQAKLETRLKATAADRRLPIGDVLEDEARKTPPGAGWRGGFAGEYWHELDASGRLGFLQGLLECQRRDANSTAKFTKAEDWYVAEISKSYGLRADDPAAGDEGAFGTGIVDVLLRLADSTSAGPLRSGITDSCRVL